MQIVRKSKSELDITLNDGTRQRFFGPEDSMDMKEKQMNAIAASYEGDDDEDDCEEDCTPPARDHRTVRTNRVVTNDDDDMTYEEYMRRETLKRNGFTANLADLPPLPLTNWDDDDEPIRHSNRQEGIPSGEPASKRRRQASYAGAGGGGTFNHVTSGPSNPADLPTLPLPSWEESPVTNAATGSGANTQPPGRNTGRAIPVAELPTLSAPVWD